MSTGRTTVTVYFAITGGALLIGRFAPWPVWISLVLALAVVVTVVLLAVRRSSPSPPPETALTYAAVPSVERREERVTDILLPSKREDYYFLFSATVLWSPIRAVTDESMVNVAARAVDAVLKRARDITEQRDPDSASLVRHELGSTLGEMRKDATGRLQVMAESINLVLPDHDQQRLDKLATVRKDEAVWEHERKYEQSKREYLSEDVLKDPGSAVVWWLAKNNDHVEKTVQDIGLLAQLSAAANNTDVPESFRRFSLWLASADAPEPPNSGLNGSGWPQAPEGGRSAADYFDAFLHAMDLGDGDPERVLFARRVADLAAKHGQQEVADEIVQRFDTPDNSENLQGAEDGG
jgi:hypothetical protein